MRRSINVLSAEKCTNSMPLTPKGRKIMGKMEEEYGDKKGESVFYASINKHKAGSNKWHESKLGQRK